MLRPVRLRCAWHGRTERLTIRCASAAAIDNKGPLFLSRFYTVKVLNRPLLMGENGGTWWRSRNRLSKSTLSPYMAINWAPDRGYNLQLSQALLSTSKQRIGGSSRQAGDTRNGGEHGELSSAAGRAVRRHGETSKI